MSFAASRAMQCSKQTIGIEAFSNLPLRFRSDNFGIDRAAEPISVWKPVRRFRGGGLLAVLVGHGSRDCLWGSYANGSLLRFQP
jgi:hypothetical protein